MFCVFRLQLHLTGILHYFFAYSTLFVSKKKGKMRTTHIFTTTTNINLINQIHKQFNNHLSSLSTFNHLFAFTSTNFHLITINYHNYSTIKTTTFDLWLFQQFKFNRFIVLNQYNRHFFFSKIFNSNLKLISTKNNQSIDQSTNTILKYLSL